MELTPEEERVLAGEQGPVLQKVMKTLVRYGQVLEAERFVDIEGDGHFAIHHALPGIGPRIEMLEELVEAGLRTKYPFTLDPRPPLDYENLSLTPEQVREFERMFVDQQRFDERIQQLGLQDKDAYTCTPYFPVVGNVPQKGTILAWSESSCVVFANSVLGARTHRNAVIIDLLSNIAGKTPLAGLLTDEGRRASWLVRLRTARLPNPQLLGAAIATKVLGDVPFIVGLGRFLGPALTERSVDYLKEMGAACAAIGAVGLFHVEDITPEAVEQGTGLLLPDHRTYEVDERELQALLDSYPVMWTDQEAKPKKCLIGCPHLSLRELHWWTDHIHAALQAQGRSKVAVETILFAAPQVLRRFTADAEAFERSRAIGVRLSAACAEAYMDNHLVAREAVVTNSNKLRAFTTARFFRDNELLGIIVTGDL